MFFEAMFMTGEQAILQSENKASKADAFSDEKQSNKIENQTKSSRQVWTTKYLAVIFFGYFGSCSAHDIYIPWNKARTTIRLPARHQCTTASISTKWKKVSSKKTSASDMLAKSKRLQK